MAVAEHSAPGNVGAQGGEFVAVERFFWFCFIAFLCFISSDIGDAVAPGFPGEGAHVGSEVVAALVAHADDGVGGAVLACAFFSVYFSVEVVDGVAGEREGSAGGECSDGAVAGVSLIARFHGFQLDLRGAFDLGAGAEAACAGEIGAAEIGGVAVVVAGVLLVADDADLGFVPAGDGERVGDELALGVPAGDAVCFFCGVGAVVADLFLRVGSEGCVVVGDD